MKKRTPDEINPLRTGPACIPQSIVRYIQSERNFVISCERLNFVSFLSKFNQNLKFVFVAICNQSSSNVKEHIVSWPLEITAQEMRTNTTLKQFVVVIDVPP